MTKNIRSPGTCPGIFMRKNATAKKYLFFWHILCDSENRNLTFHVRKGNYMIIDEAIATTVEDLEREKIGIESSRALVDKTDLSDEYKRIFRNKFDQLIVENETDTDFVKHIQLSSSKREIRRTMKGISLSIATRYEKRSELIRELWAAEKDRELERFEIIDKEINKLIWEINHLEIQKLEIKRTNIDEDEKRDLCLAIDALAGKAREDIIGMSRLRKTSDIMYNTRIEIKKIENRMSKRVENAFHLRWAAEEKTKRRQIPSARTQDQLLNEGFDYQRWTLGDDKAAAHGA